KPAVVPRTVTPQISHLNRSTALNTRLQSTPPSESAPPHSVVGGGGDGGTITGEVEPGGSGRWLIVMERVPLQVAPGVASENCGSLADEVWQVRYRALTADRRAGRRNPVQSPGGTDARWCGRNGVARHARGRCCPIRSANPPRSAITTMPLVPS